jgi:hypothetical protein
MRVLSTLFDTLESSLDVAQKGITYLDRGMDSLLEEQAKDQGMERLRAFAKAKRKASKLLGKPEDSAEVKAFLKSIGYK